LNELDSFRYTLCEGRGGVVEVVQLSYTLKDSNMQSVDVMVAHP